MFAKSWKRRENMGKAVDRLAKEEYEQLDELSKGTLKRYSDAAHKDFMKNFQNDQHFTGVHAALRKAMAKTNSATGGVHSLKGRSKNPLRKHDAVQAGLKTAADAVTAARAPFKHKMKVRNQGMDRADARLNKEEVEQLDEAMLASHIGGSSMIVHHDLADHKERHKKVLSLHKNLTKLGYSTKSKEHLNIAHHEKTKDTVHGSKYDNKDVTYTHPSKPHKTMQYWTDHADRQGKRNHVVQVFNQRAKKANLPESVGLDERSLSTGEKAAMEKNVKGMKKNIAGFKERYGKDAKSVMYATATKQAKGE
jgi:hypothetical protein